MSATHVLRSSTHHQLTLLEPEPDRRVPQGHYGDAVDYAKKVGTRDRCLRLERKCLRAELREVRKLAVYQAGGEPGVISPEYDLMGPT